jgi:hypothetical protein
MAVLIDIDTLRRQVLSPASIPEFGKAAEPAAVRPRLIAAWRLGTDRRSLSRTVDQPPIQGLPPN